MNNWMSLTLAGVALLGAVPGMANPIDVTHSSQVTLDHNDELIFHLSTDYSLGDPMELEFLLGGVPLGGPVAPIPGTSGVYMAGILFSATLESANGSISIPFSNADAERAGLPAGTLPMVPGSRSGGSYSGAVDLVTGGVRLDGDAVAALISSGEAVIDLHNLGGTVTFGYPGSAITNDFAASWTGALGGESGGARLLGVQCVRTPEPATIGVLLIGLAIMLPRVLGKKAA